MLRATGRIFLGLGPDPGSEAGAPTEEEQERADRPFWLMMTPAAILIVLALVPGSVALRYVATAIAAFAHPDSAALLRLAPQKPLPDLPLLTQSPHAHLMWVAVASSLGIAGYTLFRERLPQVFKGATRSIFGPLFHGLETVHSGLVNDYVAWIAIGVAAVAAAFAVG